MAGDRRWNTGQWKGWGERRQADWAGVQKGRYEEKKGGVDAQGGSQGTGKLYGHQRGEEFLMGQEGLVCASLPVTHPIRPRVLPKFPMVHVSCSPQEPIYPLPAPS